MRRPRHREALTGTRRRRAAGFTLLETCIVLVIIAILLGVLMPSIHTAFVESALRADSRQLALMVKTAMLQSNDQHHTCVIDLTPQSLDLHGTGDASASSAPVTDADTAPATTDFDSSYRLDPADRLVIPDPKKPSVWISMPDTSWIFQPGDLCPATRVRMTRGDAWVEMSFNALTGNVENEAAYFP
jgi:prepilin-type N-terminal cleavage/methylation domain-containing protein